MTTLHDAQGHALTGATGRALDHYEQAAHELRCLVGDPLASIDRALAEAPGMAIAHVLRAWLHLLGTEPDALPEAAACAARATACAGTERERRHAQAATRLAAGHWHDAARLLEDLSIDHPHDLLALQAGHQVDFFTGQARLLRDRIARVLPRWDAARPGFHAVLGMHAFGLEECGDYAAAEQSGRRAIELQPRDTWAWHAVAHVHEMRNDADAGIAWLAPNRAVWSTESFFAVHNTWHLALFLLEQDRHDEVLALYDEAIAGSSVVLDLIDQSAMLWRLHLRGVPLGDRFAALAARWAPLAAGGNYAFNDLHAALAFVGAGRTADLQRVLDAQQAALASDGDNRMFVRDVGAPAVRAVQAFGAGDFDTAAELLRGIRSHAHRFGGSHAQRDLLDLTLLEAALRGRRPALGAALAAERTALRPRSPLARRAVQASRR
jgi:tetratricopeptide (TPR) repeat protein